MKFFVRFAVAASLLSTSAVAAQSPRFSFELGAGRELTKGGDYFHTSSDYESAKLAVRLAQPYGFGVQLLGSVASIGSEYSSSLDCPIRNGSNDCLPLAVGGTQWALGLAIERRVLPFLSLRGGASASWLNGAGTLGPAAHSYPFFGEAILRLVPHVAATVTLDRGSVRSLDGGNVTMQSRSYGIRIY
jgi:hypothetical protein